MKKIIQNSAVLLLAMVIVVSAFTVPAFAKSDKSAKSGKETSSAVCDGSAAITLDQAKDIALGHAGVDSSNAVFSRAKLDKTVYELKFSVPGIKYEYEISINGTILGCETEKKEPHDTPNSSASDPLPSYEAKVSRSQACQIALDDAGLDGETLKYVTCYVLWLDHTPYAYEVKFSTRTTNYHYTIDLDSGAILDSSCISSITGRTTAPVFMNRGGYYA